MVWTADGGYRTKKDEEGRIKAVTWEKDKCGTAR